MHYLLLLLNRTALQTFTRRYLLNHRYKLTEIQKVCVLEITITIACVAKIKDLWNVTVQKITLKVLRYKGKNFRTLPQKFTYGSTSFTSIIGIKCEDILYRKFITKYTYTYVHSKSNICKKRHKGMYLLVL